MSNPNKILGHPSYNKIGHLPQSRLGPADHTVHPGQAAICLEKARDKHDEIIVTEKLDGSNVGVANIDGQIVAVGRAGYAARSSPHIQHHLFADWVDANADRFRDVLWPGARLCGEWMAQAHGTIYRLRHEPFVAFDLRVGQKSLPFDKFLRAVEKGGFTNATVLHRGPPISIEAVEALLRQDHHGAGADYEGAVWRVERRGEFDFIAKWVRQDKQDGCLLPEISGANQIIWNWHPDGVAASDMTARSGDVSKEGADHAAA